MRKPPPFYSILAQAIPFCAIVLVFLANLASVNLIPTLPYGLTRLDRDAGLAQAWTLFAPRPPRYNVWLTIPALRADGSEVNLFTGESPVSWERPSLSQTPYGHQRWQRLFLNIYKSSGEKSLEPEVGSYLCKTWNETHGENEQILKLSFYRSAEAILGPSKPITAPSQTLLWEGSCGK